MLQIILPQKNITLKVVWNTKHKSLQFVIHLVQHPLHISIFARETLYPKFSI